MIELETIEIGSNPSAAVIWLHGLGADGHDFVPIVPQLGLPGTVSIRFIFPHAPMQPVTINGGYVMRAWYDIKDTNLLLEEDKKGIQDSQGIVNNLIDAEINRGIAANRIILAGFSQGGAIALYTGLRSSQQLAGILALSTYLPLADTTETERSEQNRSIPIMMAHGIADPVVPLVAGLDSKERLIQLGYSPNWYEYSMEHSICEQEIVDIGRWLSNNLDSTSSPH